jgi:hypothetical protein
LFEVIFSFFFFTLSLIVIISAIIFQYPFAIIPAIITSIIGYLLFIGFPIRPIWTYLDENN